MAETPTKLLLFVLGIAAVATLIMFVGINDDSSTDTNVFENMEFGESSEATYEQSDDATEYDVVVTGVRADGGKFEGVDTCKICHSDQYDGWKETGHGKDFTPGGSYPPVNNRAPDPDYSGSCANCHVVGLGNTENGGFDPNEPWASETPTGDQKVGNVKLIGIQCESCHGPGEEHVASSDKENDPMIIGNPTVEESCYDDGDSGCHGPDGHDKYTIWKASMHSNQDQLDTEAAGGSPRGMNSYCARCKSPSQWDDDPSVNYGNAEEFTAAEWHGIGCADCHDVHAEENEYQLKTTIEEACTICHTSEATEPDPGHEPHHVQMESYLGNLGIGVSGQKGMAGVTCVDCHMWQSPEVSHGYYMDMGIGTEHKESHDFEAKAESCADCHSNVISTMPDHGRPDNNTGENEELWDEWDEFGEEWNETVEMWEMVIHDWQANYERLFEHVEMNHAAAQQAVDDAVANGTASAETIAEAQSLIDDATWNIGMTDDGSDGVHNPDFFTDLLNKANVDSNMALEMISTNGEPIANAGLSKLVDVGTDTTFDGTASSDMDGTIEMWYWDFGDGSNGTTATMSHSYPTAGTYLVTLTITDNGGATDMDMITVFVVTPPVIPEVDLTDIEADITTIQADTTAIQASLDAMGDPDNNQVDTNKDDISDLDSKIGSRTAMLGAGIIVVLLIALVLGYHGMETVKAEINKKKDD